MALLGRLRKCKCLLESTTIEVAFFTKASPVQGEVAFSQENDGRVVTIFWLMKDRTNPSVSHSLDSSPYTGEPFDTAQLTYRQKHPEQSDFLTLLGDLSWIFKNRQWNI